MARYDNTKFYWLQLKEDFFEDDAMQWLEEQQPNGREYAYFYLKLCLKSLKSNGILIRKVGNILIPYDNRKLAELTRVDFDTVTVAMELLKKIGLVKILENGEIYIEQLQNLIGSKSIGAFKKQQQRLLSNGQGGQGVDKCPPEIEIEIELEKEIEQEIEIEKKIEKEKKKVSKKVSFDDLINNYTCNEELRKELKNHLATRKSKKATLTNRAIELSFNKLDELAKNVPINDADELKIKIVQQSIERGWTGFFELKTQYGSKINNDGWDYINNEFEKAKNNLF